jgi:hypothetical protein
MKGYFDELPDGCGTSVRILRGLELPKCDGFNCLGGQPEDLMLEVEREPWRLR